MARADLLTDLVRFGIAGDRVRLRKVIETLIVEERAKNHIVLAKKLEGLLCTVPPGQPVTNGRAVLEPKVSTLFQEVIPECSFEDLVLPDVVRDISEEIVQEHHRIDLLRSYNLESRNRILLMGPPGNGKTSLAGAFAHALMVPLLIVRYESIIGAYLGETTVRLHRLLEHARMQKCVLFFDEFETLGKERGDQHETGEIKRVVSTLLMQIDSLPSHVMVIGATNHAELLDRAVWRRFQVRINLPAPTQSQLTEWFAKFEKRINTSLGYTCETIAKKLYGVSFAEAEEFGIGVYRQYVLELPESNMKKIINRALKKWPALTVKAKQRSKGNE